ncbi:unnamed protein product [Meganyctiphanes norvegica]|uniref:F-box domain-containing protein n=1 Tax=Meganyctiphanes norvegica TaxID=48144 RepID=A0AAV2QSS0_MEGNR
MSGIETTPFEDGSSMFLHDLPVEVLLLILKNCSAQDLVAIGQTCSHFRNIIASDTLWKSVCIKDFSVKTLGRIKSYYNLYSKLLHKHGWMLGTYHCQIEPYGGLFEIRYQDEEIHGINLLADASRPTGPLTEYLMFIIKSSEHDPQCVINSNTYHTGKITKTGEKTFTYICENTSAHGEEETEHMDIYEGMGLREGIIYKRIDIQNDQKLPQNLKLVSGNLCPQVISPGIFTAVYGGHGVEIVYFDFQNENIIHGLKITGDPNVYSGKTTIKFDIRHQVTPSIEEQRSLDMLKSFSPHSSVPVQSIQSQRFVIPGDCQLEADETPVPDRCIARYKADGQIAFDNFYNPSFSLVHVAVFNNDLLGAIWIDIGHFRFYHRVNK